MVLPSRQIRHYYDRLGRMLDTQSFYEGPPQRELIGQGKFGEARRVFEFGCGTGKFAAELLSKHLPATATYLGCDLSETMVRLATARLAAFGECARLLQTGGEIRFPLADGSVDRVVCTYVLDLLAEEDIRRFLGEARRVLIPGGKLCLVSLTHGVTAVSRLVSRAWDAIFRWRPTLVGGCRPVLLEEYLETGAWRREYGRVLTPFGIPSEVLILVPTLKKPSGP